MEARDLIALAALYVFAYYGLARAALGQLKAIEPDHPVAARSPEGISARKSASVMRMLFAKELPASGHPRSFRTKLYAARAMLLASPVVLATAVVLSVLGS